MNKVTFLFTAVCAIFCPCIYGQGNPPPVKKNSFFAEYTLEGPVYSINYDRVFVESPKLNYYFRIGLSILSNKIAFPIGGGITTGRKQHHAEFSMITTPLVESKTITYGSGTDNDKIIYLFPGAGYRYQRPAGGIFLRVIAGPAIILDPAEGDFWNMDPKVKFSFSLGAGWSFGR